MQSTMNATKRTRPRITRTGNPCTACKNGPGYLELDSQCLDCYEKYVVVYYEGKVKDSKRLLTAARQYEEQQDTNRSI
jgi:hypothetical protein